MFVERSWRRRNKNVFLEFLFNLYTEKRLIWALTFTSPLRSPLSDGKKQTNQTLERRGRCRKFHWCRKTLKGTVLFSFFNVYVSVCEFVRKYVFGTCLCVWFFYFSHKANSIFVKNKVGSLHHIYKWSHKAYESKWLFYC